MIQRVQSLFLLGVILISIALFFIPFSEKSSGAEFSANFSNNFLSMETNTPTSLNLPINTNYILILVNSLTLGLSAFIIFQFKKRGLQMKLCMLTGLIAGLFLIIIFYFSDAMLPTEIKPKYVTGVYLVGVQICLILAARSSILKDDKMVRAADRIR